MTLFADTLTIKRLRRFVNGILLEETVIPVTNDSLKALLPTLTKYI